MWMYFGASVCPPEPMQRVFFLFQGAVEIQNHVAPHGVNRTKSPIGVDGFVVAHGPIRLLKHSARFRCENDFGFQRNPGITQLIR